MKRSMNKTRFLRLRGASLIGLVVLVIGLVALLVVSPDLVLGQVNAKGGKPNKPPGKPQPPSLYRVSISAIPGKMGIDTGPGGCNEYGYVLADTAYTDLHANGTLIDPDLNTRIPLRMQLSTDVEWTRKYDAGKGLEGSFDSCYGENGYYHGAFFIDFKKIRKKTYISFTWYFDYYTATDPDVREHFALFSENIPFPAWTGENLSREVEGWFDLQYYLNDPDHRPSYVSLTNDEGLTFNLWISIEKTSQ